MGQPQDYLGQFSLLVPPFDSATQKAFFSGGHRGDLVGQVFHFCQFGSGLLLVQSEAGCGRSSVKNELLKKFKAPNTNIEFDDVDVELLSSQDEIFFRLLNVLSSEKLEYGNLGQALARLRHLIHNMEDEGLGFVVSIDNAHLLTDKMLSALAGLFQGGELGIPASVKVVFWGDEGLLERLDSIGLQRLPIHKMGLNPLTKMELVEYVEFRLRASGWNGSIIFTDVDYDKLWNQSRGVPEKINRFAHSALLDKYLSAGAVPKSSKILIVTLVLPVILTVIFLSFFYRDSSVVSENIFLVKDEINSDVDLTFESGLSSLPQPQPQPQPQPLIKNIEVAVTDEEFLKALTQSDYMLQVMGSSSRESVALFIRRQENQQSLRMYSTLRSGKQWFVVVEGPYSSKAEARKSIAGLPKEQILLSPWPRSAYEISQDLGVDR